ncbi:unnamed protein product [Closterium sp. Yama58-4]|nr:unnamed protein product [Closterium sp. Yama58-4]
MAGTLSASRTSCPDGSCTEGGERVDSVDVPIIQSNEESRDKYDATTESFLTRESCSDFVAIDILEEGATETAVDPGQIDLHYSDVREPWGYDPHPEHGVRPCSVASFFIMQASAARHADATRGMVAAEPRHRSAADETGTNGASGAVGADGDRGNAENTRRRVDRRSRGGKRSGAGTAVQEEVMENPDELIEEGVPMTAKDVANEIGSAADHWAGDHSRSGGGTETPRCGGSRYQNQDESCYPGAAWTTLHILAILAWTFDKCAMTSRRTNHSKAAIRVYEAFQPVAGGEVAVEVEIPDGEWEVWLNAPSGGIRGAVLSPPPGTRHLSVIGSARTVELVAWGPHPASPSSHPFFPPPFSTVPPPPSLSSTPHQNGGEPPGVFANSKLFDHPGTIYYEDGALPGDSSSPSFSSSPISTYSASVLTVLHVRAGSEYAGDLMAIGFHHQPAAMAMLGAQHCSPGAGGGVPGGGAAEERVWRAAGDGGPCCHERLCNELLWRGVGQGRLALTLPASTHRCHLVREQRCMFS